LLLGVDWGSTFLSFLNFFISGLFIIELGNVVNVSALDSLVLLKSPSEGSSLGFERSQVGR